MSSADTARAWNLLEQVFDPEVPVLSVVDLGIVRGVEVEGEHATVTLTPTYSGCPALLVIEQSVAEALQTKFGQVTVHTVLSPAWTSDWISQRGRDRLRKAGIAPPPGSRPAMASQLTVIGQTKAEVPHCPRCESGDVERLAEFGATACKALWRCRACAEPFEYFKPI